MRLTIVLALVTSGFSQFGLIELAELTYVAAAVAAWTYGGRAIASAMPGEPAERISSASPSHAQS